MSPDVYRLYDAFLAQVAAESYFERVEISDAFLVRERLQNGNNRPEFLIGNPFPPGVTRLTTQQANEFTSKYIVLHQWSDDPRRPTFLRPGEAGYLQTRGQPIVANTGLSATLLESTDNPGVFTLAIRSTEYLEPLRGGDYYRDVKGADIGGIVDGALALAQWDALERYYRWLKEETPFLAGVRELHVTGYSLGGHLAQVFTETHPEVISATIFNGAGRGSFDQAGVGSLRAVLGLYRAMLASPSIVQPKDGGVLAVYGRNNSLLTSFGNPGGEVAEVDSLYARALSAPYPPPVNIYDHPRYLYAREVVSRLASLSGGKIEGVLELILFDEFDDVERSPIAPSAADRITQIYGRAANNDRELVAGSNIAVPGNPVFIEDQPLFTGRGPLGSGSDDDFGGTHSITLIGDSLAVMRLFRKIDPGLNSDTLGKLLARMSDQRAETVPLAVGQAEGDSLERAVKALGRIYGLALPDMDADRGVRGFGRIDLREVMHQNILAIEKRVESSRGRVIPLWDLDPGVVAASARGNSPQALAFRYALSEMLPFAIVTDGPLYESRLKSGELKLSDERLHDGSTVGDRWLQDRARLLASVLQYNALDLEGRPGRVPIAGADPAKGARAIATHPAPDYVGFVELSRPLAVAEIGKRSLYGNRFQDSLSGFTNSDFFWGGGGHDTLQGLDGDDTLVGGEGADLLDGGRGKDVYVIRGQGDVIVDLDAQGSVFFERSRLAGGYGQTGANVYWSPDGITRYGWTGDLLHASVKSGSADHAFDIRGFRNKALGIYLDHPRNPAPAPRIRFQPSTATRRIDPLTLDLDLDDHLDLLPVSRSTAWFDLTNDGLAERVGWIAPADGLLVRDVNGNGFIDGVIEAFGGHTNDGFRDLAALDANRDRVIDASDPLFPELQVWQDLDGDGRSDEGELRSLESLAITAFPLAHRRTAIEQDGNLIAALGSYIRNGVARKMGDVELAYDAAATVSAATWSASQSFAASLDPELFSLPWLRGYGTVRDLPVAMQSDLSLRARVTALAAAPLHEQLAGFDALLVQWTGYARVRSAAAPAALSLYDKVWMLEAFAGERVSSGYIESLNGYGPVANGRLVVDEAMVEREWRRQHAHVALMFALQSGALGTARTGWFSVGEDRFEITDRAAFDGALATALGTLPDGGAALWLHGALQREAYLPEGFLARPDVSASPNAWLLTGPSAPEAILRAADAGGRLAGLEASRDLLLPGPGIDQLEGGLGDDTYAILPSAGADTIRDLGGNDTVLVSPAYAPATTRVSATADGALVLHWSPAHRTRLDAVLREDGAGFTLERIRFADGTLWTAAQLRDRALQPSPESDYLPGTPGADTLAALAGDDTLDGGAGSDRLSGDAGHDLVLGNAGNDVMAGGPGDDTLEGGAGDDTFLFARGDGSDRIIESATGGFDTLVFGVGIAAGDVVATASPAGLELALRGTADRLFIAGWTSASWPIEQARFADGTSWEEDAWLSIASQPSEGDDFLASGPGDDSVFALGGNDRVEAGAGNDQVDGGTGNDDIDGQDGDDTLLGADGDDWLTGGAGNDRLDGGAGSDQLHGAAGDDTYVHATGSGSDTVFDAAGLADVVLLGPGIAPGDVRVRATSRDLEIRIGQGGLLRLQSWMSSPQRRIESVLFTDHPGTVWREADLLERARVGTDAADYLPGSAGADSIVAAGGDDTVLGDAGDDTLRGGEGRDLLQGAGGADRLFGDAAEDTLAGDDGDDVLHGGTGADNLDGGAGNDFLEGGPGADTTSGSVGDDTYAFARGDGADFLSDADGQNELRFAAGIAPTDVAARFTPNGLHLALRGTADSVLLANWLQSFRRFDRVRFADDTLWDEAALRARALQEPGEGPDLLPGGAGGEVIAGLGGADTINGGDGDDRIDAGAGDDGITGDAGNDTLVGGPGSDGVHGGPGDDVFEYARGDGIDRITDESGQDTLRFATGIAPADVRVARRGDDFELALRDGSGRVALASAASDWNSAYRIESIAFSDGTRWDRTELLRRAREGTPEPDSLVGGEGADTLEGLGGDDVLLGLAGADLLDGGPGHDRLEGGSGDDSYRFDGGRDTVVESGGGIDTVFLGPGFDPDTLLVRVDHVGMTLSAGADALLLAGNGNEAAPVVERVHFAGGAQWDVAGMFAASRRTTPGADSILGAATAERYDADGGDDTVFAYAGDDTLLGGAGKDSLSGGEGNDLIDGGPGDDQLFGEWNDDEYVFARGGGNDRLFDAAGSDRVRVSAGILPAEVRVALDGSGTLRLMLRDGSGSLAMQSWATPNYRIEQVLFHDGTEWDEAALRQRALEATDGADVLAGTLAGERIAGLGGDDTLFGDVGDDTLEGGPGADNVSGGPGNDQLSGGAGDDELQGGGGDDRFVVAAGDGVDVVSDAGGLDTIEFAPGIVPGDVSVLFSGNDLVLRHGASDRVTLLYWRTSINDRIEAVRFADGTTWDVAALTARASQPAGGGAGTGGGTGAGTGSGTGGGTSGGTTSGGTGGGTGSASGGGGSAGGGGAVGGGTTSGGTGSGTPQDPAPTPIVYPDPPAGLPPAPVVLSGRSIADALSGTPASEILRGLGGDDTLSGGRGDDTLQGGGGRDVLRFGPGDGRDVVDASGGAAAEDVLWLDPGFTAQQLRVQSAGLDLLLGFDNGPDTVRVARWWQEPSRRLAQVRFDDGTVFDTARLEALAATPTAGDDRLAGGSGPDRLAGGRGDDRLAGGAGDDTYVFDLGDGHDRIADAAGTDVLRFGSGIAPGQVSVRRDGFDALLALPDEGGSVRIEDAWSPGADGARGWGAGSGAVERIEFADGTQWDAGALRSRALAAAPALAEPIGDLRVGERQPFALALPASAFATRGGALSLALERADGAPLPGWLRFDAATRTLHGLAPESATGRWALALTARDAAGLSVKASFALQVEDVNHAPRIERPVAGAAVRAGTRWTLDLPADVAADPDAVDVLALSLRTAAGAPLPAWIGFDTSARRLTAEAPADFRGAVDLQLVATDGAGASASSAFTLTVLAPNRTPVAAATLAPPPLVAGEPWLWRLPPDAIVDPDSPRAPRLSLTTPDGGALPAWLGFDPDTGTVHGVAPDGLSGPLPLRLVAEDAEGGTAAVTLPLEVSPVAVAAARAATGVPSSVSTDAPVSVTVSVRGAWRAPGGAGGSVAVQLDGRTIASVALGARARTHELTVALHPGEVHRLGIVAPDVLVASGARVEIHAVRVAGLALEPLPGGPFLPAADPASGADIQAAVRGGALHFALPAFVAGLPRADRLWGGAGATAMAGGGGSDTYVLDHAGDTITERPGGGFDELQAWRDAVLPAHVEALALAGEARSGTGNDAANRLIGTAGDDSLQGGGGSDLLHGGGGDDRLAGGAPFPDRLVITARGTGRGGEPSPMAVAINGTEAAVIAVDDGPFSEYVVPLPASLAGAALDVRLVATAGGFGAAARMAGVDVASVRLGEGVLAGAVATPEGGSRGLRADGAAVDDPPGLLHLRGREGARFGFAAPLRARDVLEGGAGDDTLAGSGLLAGGPGNDLLRPGPGASVLAFTRGDGKDVVEPGGADRLTLSLSGMPADALASAREGDDLVLGLGEGDSLRLAGWYGPAVAVPLVLQHFEAAWEAASGPAGQRIATVEVQGPADLERALQGLVQAEAVFGARGALGGAPAALHASAGTLAGLELVTAQRALSDSAFGVSPQLF